MRQGWACSTGTASVIAMAPTQSKQATKNLNRQHLPDNFYLWLLPPVHLFSARETCSMAPQLEQAEFWLREALSVTPLEARDHALFELSKFIQRREGGRVRDAIDTIIR